MEKKLRRTSKRGRVGKVSRQSIYQKYIDKYRQEECLLDKIRVYVKETKYQNEKMNYYEDENESKHNIENKNTIRNQILTDHPFCSCLSFSNSYYFPQDDSYISKSSTLFEHLNYSHPKIEKTDTFGCQPFKLQDSSEHNYMPQSQEDQICRHKELRIILERVQVHKFSHTYSHKST